MVKFPKNTMLALEPEQRELIKEYRAWLLRNGYKEGSVQTLGRKAARYLYLCEKEGLDPADDVSLLKVDKMFHELAIRAKKFVEFLRERKEESQLSDVSIEEKAASGVSVPQQQFSVPEQSLGLEYLKEILNRLEKLEEQNKKLFSFLKEREVKRVAGGFNLEMFVGKPVTIKTTDNKFYSGELLGFDEDMLYVLAVVNGSGDGDRKFHHGTKRTPYTKKTSSRSMVYSISRQIVESLEVPASFFDFDVSS